MYRVKRQKCSQMCFYSKNSIIFLKKEWERVNCTEIKEVEHLLQTKFKRHLNEFRSLGSQHIARSFTYQDGPYAWMFQ